MKTEPNLKNNEAPDIGESPPGKLASALQKFFEACCSKVAEKTAKELEQSKKITSIESRLGELESENRQMYDLLGDRLPKMSGLDELVAQHTRLLEGFLDERVMDLFRGIIPVLDRIEARLYVLTNLIRSRKLPARETLELLSFLKGVRIELVSLLSANGIEQFTTGKKTFSGKHHQATKFVTCDDPSLDGTIFRYLKPAYKRNGTMIRPEIVEVYRYEDNGGKEI
jgi:molecular chaperone GrpE (heat shock protein)